MSASERNKLDTETLHKTPSREQWIHEESGRRFLIPNIPVIYTNKKLTSIISTQNNNGTLNHKPDAGLSPRIRAKHI